MMKLIKNVIILFMLSLLSMSSTCDDNDDYKTIGFFKFENQSDESVYITEMEILNDTTNLCNNELFFDKISISGFHEISKGKTYQYEYPKSLETRHFQINVYKHSTISRYSRQELIDNNIYDKRYVLSLAELKDMNFKIIYTGNE